MNQRQAVVLAMRVRPPGISRRQAHDLACSIYGVISRFVWRVTNPRFAWFAARVRWHYAYGLPMPKKPAYSIPA